ncbi:MAG: flagellar biosynthetic protein FliR [Bdellovibrionales bacterium]|nr:flagellar biosynthetic protein FliR [Bdellovibrionales bacterium]
MSSIYQFNEMEILAFFLVIMRVSAYIISSPVIGSETVSAPMKILFSLSISLVLFPTLDWSKIIVDLGSYQIVWMALKELFVGLCIGFLSRAFVFILSIAGEVVSVSMGLSSTQLFNPTVSDRVSSLDQLFLSLGFLFFLSFNGHHLFIGALRDSYDLVPMSQESLSFVYFKEVGQILHEITIIGIKLASPVMISVLFLNVAMAVVGRAVPQINVLVSSLPINILAGFLILFVSLPMVMWQMPELLRGTAERLFQMVKAF